MNNYVRGTCFFCLGGTITQVIVWFIAPETWHQRLLFLAFVAPFPIGVGLRQFFDHTTRRRDKHE